MHQKVDSVTSSVHSDYEGLMKDVVLEQLSHIKSTHDLWDKLWCNLLAGSLPMDISVRLRDTIERVSLLYATALRCTSRLSRQELDIRYNCLVTRMHEMRMNEHLSQHTIQTRTDKASDRAPNMTIHFIQSHDTLRMSDWIVSQHDHTVKGIQWRPVCSVFGTDHIMCTETITYYVRSSLLAAAWSMMLIHPKQSTEFTTVLEIVENVYYTDVSPFHNECALAVQTELMQWILIRADHIHAKTFEKHMSDLLPGTFKMDIYEAIAIKQHAFFVPVPSVYTAFIIDLIVAYLSHVPAGIGKYYAPNATPIERWCLFTRYHMHPVTRNSLLDNWDTDQLQKLERRNYVYNASTWDDSDDIDVSNIACNHIVDEIEKF